MARHTLRGGACGGTRHRGREASERSATPFCQGLRKLVRVGSIFITGVALAQHTLGAEAYAWRGEKERAFKWLELAFAERDGGMTYVRYDPLLHGIRSDPRYKALLKKMNLPVD
jgi:hypothetical protein